MILSFSLQHRRSTLYNNKNFRLMTKLKWYEYIVSVYFLQICSVIILTEKASKLYCVFPAIISGKFSIHRSTLLIFQIIYTFRYWYISDHVMPRYFTSSLGAYHVRTI